LYFNHEEIQKTYERSKRSSKQGIWEDYISKIMPELIKYNERDVTALSELVDKLEEVFKSIGIADLFNYPTMPSLAYSALKETEVLEYQENKLNSLRGAKYKVDVNLSNFSYNLEECGKLSSNINSIPDVDSGMLFRECLSKVPDKLDLFIRKGIIAAGSLMIRWSWNNVC
jgi:hypothetical protein